MLAFKPFDTALGRSGLIPKATSTQWTGDTDVCIYNTNETDIDKAMKDSRTRITKFIDGGYAIADSIMTEEVKQLLAYISYQDKCNKSSVSNF